MKAKLGEYDPFQIFITGWENDEGYDYLAQFEIDIPDSDAEWIKKVLYEYDKVQKFLRPLLEAKEQEYGNS